MNYEKIPQYHLDWSKGKVYAKDVPRDVVERKFKLLNDFISHKLTEVSGNAYDLNKFDTDLETQGKIISSFFETVMPKLPDADKDYLQYLLSDDTIYAYALLRYNGRPVKLRYYQDVIASDTHRYFDVEGANQQGKSFLLCVMSCVHFLRDHDKNHTIVLVSRSQLQNGINMRMIKQMLGDSIVDPQTGQDSMSVTTRKVSNTDFVNTLVCAVAGGGGLGFAADLVFLDEFEFWSEEEGKTLEWYYDQIFLQRTNETKGRVGIYSNPNGKNFVSEKLQTRKLKTGEYAVHTYNFDFLSNPSNTIEEYEDRKRWMHPITFASTMAAQRVTAEGAALNDEDIESTKSKELDAQGMSALVDRATYFFADLGFVYDQTVLVGCYANIEFNPITKRDEAIYYFVPKPYPRQYPIPALWGQEQGSEEDIASFVKRHDWQQFELDLTGKEGNEVLAQQAGLGCTGVKMSGQWKATWYDRFISLCKQGRIKVLDVDNYLDGDNKNFAYQARSLRVSTKTADGRNRPYPLYHHSSEKDHDDILDACVGALSLIDVDMNGSPGASFIQNKSNPSKHIEHKPNTIEEEGVVYDNAEQTLYNAQRTQPFY